jgi:ubiquinone/menaquinone biosynthesis C-methylase UbiE
MKRAHRWTKKQTINALVPNFGKKYITEPALMKLIGPVKGKQVLELGSGNGYWLELLSKKGAHCTGVEIANQQILLARRKDKQKTIKYVRGDITNLSSCHLKRNFYDIVFLEHVLLEISSLKKIQNIFEDTHDLLKKSGKIIISDLHPSAPSLRKKDIGTDSLYDYFSSGKIVKLVSKRIDGKNIFYKDFHWTLEDISLAIAKSGFSITDIIEPRPTKSLAKRYKELAYRRKIPMSIMFRAKIS